MRYTRDPQQNALFDSFAAVFSQRLRDTLTESWEGVFRHVILELMPVDEVGERFSGSMGRPTKELYSMAGLMLIMEFNDWTVDQAADAYRYNLNVHYALNLEPIGHDISTRTIERYRKDFNQRELAEQIMSAVSARLVEELDLRVGKQRLDSTHVFSNMANFGRTRLMATVIKQFLTQLLRHDKEMYETLPEALRERYRPAKNRLLGSWSDDEEERQRQRLEVANDLYAMLAKFEGTEHARRTTYKTMKRVFEEQCIIEEEKVVVKKKTGGRVMVNPSDPDATIDGHKGVGYQAQIVETCDPENEVQLVTYGEVQTAVESDSAALDPILDQLSDSNHQPKELLADTGYGSDDNYTMAQKKGVELVAPCPPGGRAKDAAEKLSLSDFDCNETTLEVLRCPEGHTPEYSRHVPENDTLSVKMGHVCDSCPKEDQCLVRGTLSGYYIVGKGSRIRLDNRRALEQTLEFKERYRLRSGIEGLNSALKRRLGFGRLRVRGMAAMKHALLLRLAGWNILRAAATKRMQEKVKKLAKTPYICTFFGSPTPQRLVSAEIINLTLSPLAA